MHLVLTGASGYLGQHLLSHWICHGVLPSWHNNNKNNNPAATAADGVDPGVKFRITALYHKSEGFPEAVRAFRERHGGNGIEDVVVRSVDLADPGDAVRSVLNDGDSEEEEETIVVHAAAISSPRVCQENPEAARAINVPRKFLDAVLATTGGPSESTKPPRRRRTSILALSTDQVYDGTQEAGSYYKEDEKEGLKPKNVYAETKLELERYLTEQQQQQEERTGLLVALRSSIILGPEAPIDPGCAHGTFLDFCRSRGISKEPTTFFTNEYRSVVRVDRVIGTIGGLVSKIVVGGGAAAGSPSAAVVVYNMGGPVRVNRLEMATAVFDRFGYDPEVLLEAEQKSPTSPLDISMDSSLLVEEGILPPPQDRAPDSAGTYLRDLVDYVFGGGGGGAVTD